MFETKVYGNSWQNIPFHEGKLLSSWCLILLSNPPYFSVLYVLGPNDFFFQVILKQMALWTI